jgi:hypothetical protein
MHLRRLSEDPLIVGRRPGQWKETYRAQKKAKNVFQENFPL